MLGWTLMFLVIALIAGALGFSGVAGAATGIAKILFFIFIALLLLSLLARQTSPDVAPRRSHSGRNPLGNSPKTLHCITLNT